MDARIIYLNLFSQRIDEPLISKRRKLG